MDKILNSAVRSSLFLMAGLMAMWAITPDGRAVAAGLVLGMLASLANAYLLRRSIERITEAVLKNDGRKSGLGMLSRLAVILIAAMAAIRFPEYFSLPATIAGCFYMPFSIYVFGFIHNIARRNGKG